jgi:Mn2+/Fe2+ NRAMP family transporter
MTPGMGKEDYLGKEISNIMHSHNPSYQFEISLLFFVAAIIYIIALLASNTGDYGSTSRESLGELFRSRYQS